MSTQMTTRLSERKRIVRDEDEEPGPPAKNAAIEQPNGAPGTAISNNTAKSSTTNSTTTSTTGAGTSTVKPNPYQPKRQYNFSETAESILAKYANDPPSIELHIYPTHYRFGNQEGVIPKNSPLIKTFFEYIQAKSIPPAATEVFRDSGIRFYEGCIILELIDHRKACGGNAAYDGDQNAETTASSVLNAAAGNRGNGPVKLENKDKPASDDTKQNGPEKSPSAEPTSYRAILRPTQLSLWHDLLFTTDTSHGRFTDHLASNMEAEILTLTIRNLDLRVPREELPLPTKEQRPTEIENTPDAIAKLHKYRVGLEKPPRGLHEDLVHHGTDYEDLMLIMDDKRNSSVNNMSGNGGQFMRLSFIEQLRKTRARMRVMQQQQAQQQQAQQQQQQQRAGNESQPSPGGANNNNGMNNGHLAALQHAGAQLTPAQRQQLKAQLMNRVPVKADPNRIKLTQEQRMRYANMQLEENKKKYGAAAVKQNQQLHLPYYVDQIPPNIREFVLGQGGKVSASASTPAAPTTASPPAGTPNSASPSAGKASKSTPKKKVAAKATALPKGRPKKK